MSERPSVQQIQVAATAFLALFSVVGLALYGLPFYYDFMVREMGWSNRMVTSGNAISKLLVGPLFGFLAGWIVDRFGPRRVMIGGILMAGCALIGLSRVSSVGLFYLFYVFNALGYVCGGPLPNQVLLSRWFDKSRGKAMGFAYLGIGIGGALVPLLSRWFTEMLGWRGALFCLGILVIAVALPMAFAVKRTPSPRREADPTAEPPLPVRTILRSGSFYLLAVASMCSIGAVGGTYQNIKLYLSLDHGYAQADSGRILSLVLASSLVGRLFMGWLADRFPKKYVMLLINSLVAGSIPLLFLASTPEALYPFAVLFGIGLGGDYMIIPLVAAERFGVRTLGKVLGIILTADGVAEALVPNLVATLRDARGSYSIGFLMLTCLAVVGALSITLLPRGRLAELSASIGAAGPTG